jgi:hypothetical protein
VPKTPVSKSHVDDKGWNTDTRTQGEFDNLRKNALKKDEDSFQRRERPATAKTSKTNKHSLETALKMEFKKVPVTE